MKTTKMILLHFNSLIEPKQSRPSLESKLSIHLYRSLHSFITLAVACVAASSFGWSSYIQYDSTMGDFEIINWWQPYKWQQSEMESWSSTFSSTQCLSQTEGSHTFPLHCNTEYSGRAVLEAKFSPAVYEADEHWFGNLNRDETLHWYVYQVSRRV